ncbi:MAG: hypothetical protein ACI8S6_002547, partial [Myxococcota bacterium]
AGAFYPPTVILFGLLPAAVAMNIAVLGHFWWAALGAFGLLRSLGRSELASLFGAVALGFSGFLATHALYLGMHCAVAWLPWALWAVQRRQYGLAGLCAWMMMVAGHPQAAAFSMLLLGAFALKQAITDRAWPLRFAGAMLLAIVAASPQLLATLELARFSMRDGGVSAMFANIGSLPPQEIVNGAFPRFFGFDRPGDVTQSYYHRGEGYWGSGENHWEMSFYLGIPVIGLMLWRARRQPFWSAIFCASGLLMLGGLTPLWPILRMLPGLSGFRFPVRFAILLTVAAAVLAAAGLDHLRAAPPAEKRRASWWLSGASLAVLLGLFIAGQGLRLGEEPVRGVLTGYFSAQADRPLPPPPDDLPPLMRAALPDPEPEDPALIPAKVDRIVASLKQSTSPLSGQVWGPALLLALLGGALTLSSTGRLSEKRFAAVAIALLYVDLWSFGANYQVRSPRSFVESVPAALSVMASEDGWGRATVVDRRRDPALDVELMNASLGLLYDQRDVILTSPLLMLRNDATLALAGLDVGDRGPQKVERLLDNPHIPDLLGLRWLLSVHEIDHPDYIKRLDGAVKLYENRDPLPNAFVVGCVQQPEDPWEGLKALRPRQWAVVEQAVDVPVCTDGEGAGTATVISSSAREVVIEAEGAGLLVHTDSVYPGWEATVDGELVEIVVADLLFRGVVLSEGAHEVVLRYRPRRIEAALWGMPLALLGLLGLAWTDRRQHRNR